MHGTLSNACASPDGRGRAVARTTGLHHPVVSGTRESADPVLHLEVGWLIKRIFRKPLGACRRGLGLVTVVRVFGHINTVRELLMADDFVTPASMRLDPGDTATWWTCRVVEARDRECERRLMVMVVSVLMVDERKEVS